ncbi:hypothetical protein BKA83DRAFT_1304674 [Pisolithus microcarpus]|nr:hypothetical protein BKA83DRAFT_1304674 [Pisolithus microcarpus]
MAWHVGSHLILCGQADSGVLDCQHATSLPRNLRARTRSITAVRRRLVQYHMKSGRPANTVEHRTVSTTVAVPRDLSWSRWLRSQHSTPLPLPLSRSALAGRLIHFAETIEALIESRISEVSVASKSPTRFRTPKTVTLAYLPYGRSPCDRTFRNPWEWNGGLQPHNHGAHTAGSSDACMSERRVSDRLTQCFTRVIGQSPTIHWRFSKIQDHRVSRGFVNC